MFWDDTFLTWQVNDTVTYQPGFLACLTNCMLSTIYGIIREKLHESVLRFTLIHCKFLNLLKEPGEDDLEFPFRPIKK